MKKRKAVQLIKALRSGEYHQGRFKLVNGRDEFCCLGVICNISTNQAGWKLDGGRWKMLGKRYSLPKIIRNEFGFYDHSGKRRDEKYLVINNKDYISLVDANDRDCTFDQIANYIEENWEML